MDPAEYERHARIEDAHWWHRAMRRRVLGALGHAVGNRRVLDAGCGAGGLLRAVLASEAGWKAEGVDISPEAVHFANERAGCPVQAASVQELPHEEASLAAVLCTDVIYHEAVDDVAALAEFHRVLEPGGRLILTSAAFECLRGEHDIVVRTARRYTKPQVEALLERSGFVEYQVRYAFHWLFLPMYAWRRLKKPKAGKAARSDLELPAPWMNQLLDLLCRVDAALGSCLPIPFGTSIFAVAKRGPDKRQSQAR